MLVAVVVASVAEVAWVTTVPKAVVYMDSIL